MLDSIYIGMSGLISHSKGLQTISNNVANLNTSGFKSTTPRFSDLYHGKPQFDDGADWMGSASQGSGVEYRYSSLNFKQGEIRASDGQLDLAIEGQGFLALLDSESDQVMYARTGQFVIQDDGTVRDRTHNLQLTTIDASGALAPVSMSAYRTSPPVATSRVAFADNLSSSQSEFSIPNVEVYDATGAKQALTVRFTADNTLFPGRWRVTIEDAQGETVGDGELQFLGGIPEPGLDQVQFTLAASDGSTSTVALDFSSGVTSFSAGTYSSLRVSESDGHAFGALASLTIDEQGALVASYANGETATLGQVAMAAFSDTQRLIQVGNGLFDASHLPAPAYVDGTQGAGTLVAGAIEASNVDLSAEFGRLILIQRGFQASSQVVSTANEMLMQLFQMKGGQG